MYVFKLKQAVNISKYLGFNFQIYVEFLQNINPSHNTWNLMN